MTLGSVGLLALATLGALAWPVAVGRAGVRGQGDEPGRMQVTSNGGGFTVSIKVRGAPVRTSEPFDMDVRVTREGDPEQRFDHCSLHADARMPSHYHGMTVVPRVVALGAGRFRVQGMVLHMPGHWEVYVDLTCGPETERAQYAIDLE